MSPSGRSATATMRRPARAGRSPRRPVGRAGDRGRYARPTRVSRAVGSVRREPRLDRPGAAGRPVSMDPRMQERRADVLRQQARRRLRLALAALGVCLLVVAGWVVLHSRVFGARAVTVVGAPPGQRAAVVDAAGLAGAPPLLDVGAANAAAVDRLPWVASATISRHWPDGVRIVVTQRTPVAAVAETSPSAGFAEVDRDGRVQGTVASLPAGLVQVTGTPPPGSPGTTLGGARAALTVASSLPKAFAAQVAQVEEGPGGAVTLKLTSPLTVYLGSTADLRAKYEDVAALLAGAKLASGDVIDVSAPSTPVLRT